jgi:hypothetical protein
MTFFWLVGPQPYQLHAVCHRPKVVVVVVLRRVVVVVANERTNKRKSFSPRPHVILDGYRFGAKMVVARLHGQWIGVVVEWRSSLHKP